MDNDIEDDKFVEIHTTRDIEIYDEEDISKYKKDSKKDLIKNIFAMIGLASIIILTLYLLDINYDVKNKLVKLIYKCKYVLTKTVQDYIIEDKDHQMVYKIYKHKLINCITRIKKAII